MKRHLVNVKSANPDLRESPDRKHSPTIKEYRFDTDAPNRLTEQKRLSIYNWNPGPRRGKEEEGIEKHIAGKWHIIALQESIEYFDHDYLTNRFYVTHCGGCAVLFKNDTFHPDIQAFSVYLHDTRGGQQQVVKGGQSGWVLQGNRVSSHVHHFGGRHATANRFPPRPHQQPVCQEAWHREKVATYSLYCNAGSWDFNGAAWRRPCGNDRKLSRIIEEAFADTNLPVPPGSTPFWGPATVRGEWADVCGSIKPPNTDNEWHRTPMISGRFAYTVLSPSPTARWVFRKETQAATARCGCISLMPTLEAIARRSTNTPSGYT